MKKPNTAYSVKPVLYGALACLGLWILWLMHLSDQYKPITLLAGLGMIAVLLFADLTPLKRIAVYFLAAYVVYSGLSGLWAMAGKFFLREYSKIFLSFFLFLIVLLPKRSDEKFVRRVMGLLAGCAALFAVGCVEAASTGLIRAYLSSLSSFSGINMGFSDRLWGLVGNANISASILGVGVLISVALLCGAKEPQEKSLYAVLLTCNAFAFFLGFSMGGTACLALSVVVYLIAAGRRRGVVLLRMVACAVPTVLFASASVPFFNRGGVWNVLPLLLLAADCAVVVLLEQKVVERLAKPLEERQGLVFALLLVVIALCAAYVVAGYHLSGPYTFQGSGISRSAYPEVGVHTLNIEATGDVDVTITSQDMSQIMMHTDTVIYSGPAAGAQFTVPEGSQVCYFSFNAADGVRLDSAGLDTGETIRLKYTLLPGFVADRLQGLWANQNAIQRVVFFQDGLKMFRNHPILGNGVGAFETGVTSVQSFFYETKYIHNHYIQIMLENGLPGLVFFVGALLSLAVLLWQRRREQETSPTGWAYPALGASLVMTAAHAGVEVSLSNITFLNFAYVIFALILVVCPARVPETEPVAAGKPAKRKKNVRRTVTLQEKIAHVVCAVFPAAFILSLALNMAAYSLAVSPVANTDEQMGHFVTAASMDLYENTDMKLSYLIDTVDESSPAKLEQANKFAAQLLKKQSNSIPTTLTYYYLSTEQYALAIEAAQNAAVYSSTRSDVWNNIIQMLNTGFFGNNAPLLGDDGEELLQALLGYYDTLQAHNASSMEDIALTTASQTFFDKVLSLAQSEEDYSLIQSRLLFRSWAACDGNGDGVADQISLLENAAVGENGAVQMGAGGNLSIDIDGENSVICKIFVTCDQPECAALYDSASGSLMEPDDLDNGRAVFFVTLSGDGDTYTIQLSSTVDQTFSAVEILDGVT